MANADGRQFALVYRMKVERFVPVGVRQGMIRPVEWCPDKPGEWPRRGGRRRLELERLASLLRVRMNPDNQPQMSRNCVAVCAVIDAGVEKDPPISSQALDKSIRHGASVVIGVNESDNQWQQADYVQLANDVTLYVPEPCRRFAAAVPVGMNHVSRQGGRDARCLNIVEEHACAVKDRHFSEKCAAADVRVAGEMVNRHHESRGENGRY